MFGNLGQMISQMGDLKTKMKEMENELRALRIHGKSSDGMVSVEINGKMEVLEVSLRPEAMKTLSPLGMENAIEEALSGALTQATQAVQEKMKAVSGGLNLPGLF
jgi:DNA-binding YbaB/EbfC family protein